MPHLARLQRLRAHLASIPTYETAPFEYVGPEWNRRGSRWQGERSDCLSIGISANAGGWALILECPDIEWIGWGSYAVTYAALPEDARLAARAHVRDDGTIYTLHAAAAVLGLDLETAEALFDSRTDYPDALDLLDTLIVRAAAEAAAPAAEGRADSADRSAD